MITRIYHNHEKLEDIKNGLYKTKCVNYDKKFEKSRILLSTPYLFEIYANKVVDIWTFSSEHFLTDMNRNRRAWLGQASCCFFCGASEYVVKDAWRSLSEKQQIKANDIAEKIIRVFERRVVNRSQLNLFK